MEHQGLDIICGNEDQTRLALDDVQNRSCDETRLIEYMNRLSEQIQRDNELMEAIGENSQMLQKMMPIVPMLQEMVPMLQEMMPIVPMIKEIIQSLPMLQLINQKLPKLTEQAENSKATETNLTKGNKLDCSCSKIKIFI